jgi:hypothetical protein
VLVIAGMPQSPSNFALAITVPARMARTVVDSALREAV